MLDAFKQNLSLFLLIPSILLIGSLLSCRLHFLQVSKLFKSWSYFLHDHDFSGKKSTSFSALSAVLGGNLGTGNIAGIAVALSLGGPGSIFWMWVIAIIGAILKYAGCVLAILYRQRDERGEWVGGPMYYIMHGLKLPFTAKIYAVFTICGAFTVGNFVQMNSLALPLAELGVPHLATGFAMSLLTFGVIMGGLHRFSMVVSSVVPSMAVLYTSACLMILGLHYDRLLPALSIILSEAFHPTAGIAGVTGWGLLKVMSVGFERGLFATDVGVGIAPIIHASVDSEQPPYITAHQQGLIATLSPIIVMIVCTLTALALIVTGVWQDASLQSTIMCIEAFKLGFGHEWAGHMVTITLFFFAFTTILTWSFCADKAIEFLFSTSAIKFCQLLFVAAIPIGTLIQVQLVWSLADIFMILMLIINIIGIVALLRPVFKVYSQHHK